MRIKNTSWSPLVVTLPNGKSLSLAGRGIGEVSAEDFEDPELQRLAKSQAIVVLPEEEKQPAGQEKEEEKKLAGQEEEKKPADAGIQPGQPKGGTPKTSDELE